ncbi:MAG: hypothetical protein V1810_02130 [Candidatus Beckwithbacteria bacterium]
MECDSQENNQYLDNLPQIRKRRLIWVIIFVCLVLLLVGGFACYRFFFNPSKNEADGNARALSTKEWEVVIASASEEFSIDSVTQIASATKLENPLAKESVESAYAQVGETFNAAPSIQQIVKEEKIEKQGKMQFGLRVEGLSKNEKGENDQVDLSISYLGLQDFPSGRAQSDLIVNGKWGNLTLNDGSMDALHISTINIDNSSALVNIEASDYLLVLLDRISNPEKERQPGIISVDTEDIYPYFGNYVKVQQEVVEPDLNIRKILDETNLFEKSTFMETIGDFDKYIDSSEEKKLTTGPSGLGLIMVKMDKNKFIQTVEDYGKKISTYYSENTEQYKQACEGRGETCLKDIGYLTKEEIEGGMSLLKLFSKLYDIGKAGMIVEPETLSFRGFSMEINKNKLGNISGAVQQLLDITKISFSFYSSKLESQEKIFSPANFIMAEEKPKEINYGVAEQGNDLFAENKAYMRALKVDLWQAIMAYGGDYCNVWWEPKFCFQAPEDWNIYDPETTVHQYISLFYPLGNYASDKPHLSMQIFPPNYEYEDDCVYEETSGGNLIIYPDFKEITTGQGMHFRISSGGTKNNEFIGKVCMANRQGYTTRLPFAGAIEIYSKDIEFNEAADRFGSILESIEMQGEMDPLWLVTPSLPPDPQEYPERKQTIKYEPTRMIVDDKKVDGEYLIVNQAVLEPGKSCLSRDEYILDSYGAKKDVEIVGVFPSGQAVCMSQKNCAICNKGSWEWKTDTSACKGLRCNLE